MVRQGKFEDMNPTGISGLLRRMGDVLEQLLTRLQPGENSIIVNYPPTGNKDLPEGTHTFDFIERRVYLSDGTVEHMYTSAPIVSCRSILIYCDTDIIVRFFLNNNKVYETEILPLWMRNADIEFDEIKVTTTKNTIFHLQASTQHDGVYRIERADYYIGNPYTSDTTVAVAGAPNTEAVRTALGQNGRTGTLTHASGIGNLLVQTSHDGVTFTTTVTVGPGAAIEWTGDDLHTISIDASVNNVGYVLIVNPGE